MGAHPILNSARPQEKPAGDILVENARYEEGDRKELSGVDRRNPVLCVLGLPVRTSHCATAELRVKETDRRHGMEKPSAGRVEAEVPPDGLNIPADRASVPSFDSFGDHRIAMAFAVAARAPGASVPSPALRRPPGRFPSSTIHCGRLRVVHAW
jgi:3-phosphoshikimate 1-carboxyvinyltransferase